MAKITWYRPDGGKQERRKMRKLVITPEQTEYFKAHFYELPVRQLCAEMGFSTPTYYRLAATLGLAVNVKIKGNKCLRWTPEMESKLIAEFPHRFNDELARELGISHSSLHRKARELKLEKTPGFLETRRADITEKATKGMAKSEKCRNNPGRIRKGERKNPAGEFKKGESWCDRASAEKVREKTQKAARTRRENTYHAMIRIKYGMQSGTKQNLRRREYIPRPDDTEAWKAVRKREAREYQMRHYLRKRGYRIDGLTAFWDETTRRSPRLEAKKGPFRFLQEPAKAPELL